MVSHVFHHTKFEYALTFLDLISPHRCTAPPPPNADQNSKNSKNRVMICNIFEGAEFKHCLFFRFHQFQSLRNLEGFNVIFRLSRQAMTSVLTSSVVNNFSSIFALLEIRVYLRSRAVNLWEPAP